MEQKNYLVYKQAYKDFLASYQSGITSAEQVGKMIADLSQYFSDANEFYGKAKKEFNHLLDKIEGETDEKGKLISSAKANSRAIATNEGDNLIDAEINLKNIDNNINALKSLQKGILNEYTHMGNM